MTKKELERAVRKLVAAHERRAKNYMGWTLNEREALAEVRDLLASK